MKPSVVLLGFVLGSAAAITFALLGVLIVFALLGSEYPRLATEFPTLVSSLGMFAALTAAAGLSFYGHLRERGWRLAATGALFVGLALIGWYHWP
jgi:hypothetical protein